MNWPRVLIHVAVFAGGAATALLLSPRETPPRPLALEPLPASLPDLRDADTRQHLDWLVRYGRTGHLSPEHALFHRCRPGQDNSYALRWAFVHQTAAYIEIGPNTDNAGATAIRWPDAGYERLPPPHPPGYTEKGPGRPAPPPTRHPVSADDFNAIESGFLALAHDRVEPIRRRDGLDGGSVVLELCRGGQYGVFARMNYSDEPDDKRVLALSRQMLALVGIGEDKIGKADAAATNSQAH